MYPHEGLRTHLELSFPFSHTHYYSIEQNSLLQLLCPTTKDIKKPCPMFISNLLVVKVVRRLCQN